MELLTELPLYYIHRNEGHTDELSNHEILLIRIRFVQTHMHLSTLLQRKRNSKLKEQLYHHWNFHVTIGRLQTLQFYCMVNQKFDGFLSGYSQYHLCSGQIYVAHRLQESTIHTVQLPFWYSIFCSTNDD